jgi:Protein of unknown function (DUF1059)
MDCGSMPSDSNCTVVISGEEDEVLELAAAHAVAVHGHTDGEDLRSGLRTALRDEATLSLEPGAYLQLVEFHTRDLDRFMRLVQGWREQIGVETTGRWGVVTADRDRPDTYVEVVAFPDYDAAMRNSEHPATTRFAKEMQEVTEGDASFRNLDVREVLVV